MRIYKWVPISGEQQQKKPIIIDNSQNSINSNDKENSKMPRTDLSHEDSSNTCKFYHKVKAESLNDVLTEFTLSILGFSFSEMQYQNNNSSDKFLFSEDSNSQSSDILPVKKFKPND